MRIPLTATVLLVGLLHGSESYTLESSGEHRRTQCSSVRVEAVGNASAPETHAKRRRVRRSFSAREALDLRFEVALSLSSSSTVEIELYTPTGQLYQTLKTEPAADDGSESGGRQRRRGTRAVIANLPVAGSYITSRSLYGEWRAEVHLDGGDARCASTKFLLEP